MGGQRYPFYFIPSCEASGGGYGKALKAKSSLIFGGLYLYEKRWHMDIWGFGMGLGGEKCFERV